MERRTGDSDYSFKLVIVGDSGVGKTNLLTRFTRNQFSLNSRNTVGFNNDQKTLTIEGKIIRAEIWDTAGQERYRSMSPSFYRGSVGALIVYDVSNKESFDNIHKWIKEINTHAEGVIATLIIGNKSDRTDRVVFTEQANEFAAKHKFGLIETSAMNDVNVVKAFEALLQNIVQLRITSPESTGQAPDTANSKKIVRERNSLPENKRCTCCGSG